MSGRRMNLDIAYFQTWIGRESVETDVATADPLRRLTTLLDHEDRLPASGESLPPLSHWLYFLPRFKQSDLKPDGHGELSGHLPPIPLPRRMWAGSRFTFHAPLRIGDAMTRRSKVAKVDLKEGRSGELVFLTLEHEISTERGVAITEFQDLVYRAASEAQPNLKTPSAATTQPLPAAQWSRDIDPDPTLLFRFSALTYNAHRIHYDLDYTKNVEGYPGLIVHGPLTATLLVDLVRRNAPERRIRAFSFRGLAPLFAGAKFQVCAGPWQDDGRLELWTQNAAGAATTRAQIIVD
jgi:3-methylfumaryl-CoA hydratase